MIGNCGMEGLGSTGSNVGVSVGGAIASAAAFTGPAAPIVAAIGGLVAAASAIAGTLHIGEGCGPTCIEATRIVNSAEPVLKMNLDAYENGQISQTDALANWNQGWNAVVQSCGQIPGDAGKNCVSDRVAGSCKWKNGSDCWNWDIGYHQPLLQPSKVPMVSVGGSLDSVASTLTSSPMLLIGVGLLAVGMMSGGKN